MLTVDDARALLASGRPADLLRRLVDVEPRARRAVCRPLTGQAKAILSASLKSTVAAWLRHLPGDFPGGHAQFEGAWRGRLTVAHWDAATAVLVAAKTVAQAAKVWPIPENHAFAHDLYPALFPDDLAVIVEQWSADFAANPKHGDRNRGRAVMFEWVEEGRVAPPQHAGAVLMLLSGWAAAPGKPLLAWLRAHPTVTETVFARLLTTPGVKGASPMQTDQTTVGDPLRTVVVPGLIADGVWSRDHVVHAVRDALHGDFPAYQRRWFALLAQDLGVRI